MRDFIDRLLGRGLQGHARMFGEVEEHADGTVTINIDEFVKRTNRRTMVFALGLVLAIMAVGFVANGSRNASNDSLNATQVSLASNARNACITDRRSLQFQEQGEMTVFLIRAVASFKPEETGGVFDVAPLGSFTEEINSAAEASIRWAVVTDSLAAQNLRKPIKEGGCGPVIDSIDDLPKGGEESTTTTVTKPYVSTTEEQTTTIITEMPQYNLPSTLLPRTNRRATTTSTSNRHRGTTTTVATGDNGTDI